MLSWRNNSSNFDFGANAQDGCRCCPTCSCLSSHSQCLFWLRSILWMVFSDLFCTFVVLKLEPILLYAGSDVREILTPLDISERNKHSYFFHTQFINTCILHHILRRTDYFWGFTRQDTGSLIINISWLTEFRRHTSRHVVLRLS